MESVTGDVSEPTARRTESWQEDTDMLPNVEMHTTLTALRQAEIRREVLGEHEARRAWRERATAMGPRGLRGLALRLESTLARAFAPGAAV